MATTAPPFSGSTLNDPRHDPGHDPGRFANLCLVDRAEFTASYSAREAGTGRAVTIKILDDSAPLFAHQAFVREARYLGRLGTHPNIVTLFQQTSVADGRPALVLEACRSTLAALAREQRISVPTAVSIAIKVAGALETTHRAGLVHCAVRPQNVLLTEFDEPALADFGATVNRLDRTRLASHETTAHTAPELLLGDEPTPATDVYGLASTLYELVTGRGAYRSYEHESPAATSLRILGGRVAPIVSAAVPLELSDLLVWGMHPQPDERPPSAAWLAEELSRIEHKQGWLRTRMITGEPEPQQIRQRRFRK